VNSNTIYSKWSKIKKIYREAAKEVIGYRKSNQKEGISQNTWEKIEERKQMKGRMLTERENNRSEDKCKEGQQEVCL